MIQCTYAGEGTPPYQGGTLPKTETPTKPCEICGTMMMARPKNRKYCAACQAHRDITFMPDLKRNCESCGKEFHPIRNTFKKCYECSLWRAVNPEKFPVPCSKCGQHKRPAPGTDDSQHGPTCVSCVQSDMKFRKAYLIFLQRRIERLTTKEAA